MAKLKQGNLFDDPELAALRERQKHLDEAHREVVNLPARLEKERRERESTMPPMPEIREREQIKQFEKSLSRGEVVNILRVQRQSLAMMLLLATSTALMLLWAYRIAFP